MGFFSAIGGLVSGAVGAITGAIGSALSALGPVLSMSLDLIGKVAEIAKNVMVSLGIVPPEQEPMDLGDRVIQAGESGIKPEKFDSFDQYAEEIFSFEPDPEKSKKIDEKDKLGAFLGFSSLGIKDRFPGADGDNIAQLWNLVAKSPGLFSEDFIKSILPITQDFKAVVDYFEGNLDADDKSQVIDHLCKAEKSLNPDKTDSQIIDEIDAAKESYKQSE